MEQNKKWLVPALVIALATGLVAILVKLISQHPGRPSAAASFTVAFLIVSATAVIKFLLFLAQLWRSGEDHPAAVIMKTYKTGIVKFLPIPLGVALMSVFLYSITFLKSMIASIIPFWADSYLAAVDSVLRIDGEIAARLLEPTLPLLGVVYGLWHVVNLGGIIWVIHWRSPKKARHILGFMLTWSFGIVAAYIFSSAGPIFTGDYDPNTAPSIVRAGAEFLWNNYQQKGAVLGGGISAFPSMHVAIATWFAIALADRGAKAIGLTYVAAIFICSVILGWHYSLDGLGGVAIALFADKIAQSWMRRRQLAHGPPLPDAVTLVQTSASATTIIP